VTKSITERKKPKSGSTTEMKASTKYTLSRRASASPRVQETSTAAFESLTPEVKSRRERQMLEYIKAKGGATCWEVATALGLLHQSASAAITKLGKKGRIFDTGQRKPTGTGRMAIVWAIASATEACA
jgi:hypothetical protein